MKHHQLFVRSTANQSIRLKRIAYVCLLTLVLGCSAPHADSSAVMIDWPAVFSQAKTDGANGFRLYNAQHLHLPQAGSSFHQQGIQQLPDGGWAVSGSGKEQGYLYFTDPSGIIHTVYTIPDDLSLAGPDASLKYNHPGGFQITGNMLAVGLENTDLRRDSYSRVVFLDISDPRSPVHYAHLDVVRETEAGKVMTAGAVGITELEDTYLIIVGNWDSARLDFYTTSSKDLADKNTSVSACLGSWIPGEAGNSYQNINVYGQSPEALYLVGMYSVDRTRDRADLLQLNAADWNSIRLVQKQEQEFNGGEASPRFVHASGTTFDPQTRQLRFYSLEADAQQDTIIGNVW